MRHRYMVHAVLELVAFCVPTRPGQTVAMHLGERIGGGQGRRASPSAVYTAQFRSGALTIGRKMSWPPWCPAATCIVCALTWFIPHTMCPLHPIVFVTLAASCLSWSTCRVVLSTNPASRFLHYARPASRWAGQIGPSRTSQLRTSQSLICGGGGWVALGACIRKPWRWCACVSVWRAPHGPAHRCGS